MQDVGDFVRGLFEKHKDGIDWIKKVREDIIRRGKKSDAFKKLGVEKGRTDPKYADPDDLESSGAASLGDCIFLYLVMAEYRPVNILEIGTWFGTTSDVMGCSAYKLGYAATIRTCDKHNVYCGVSPLVEYHNTDSTTFLKKLMKQGYKADMVFIDGRLKAKDDKRLHSLFHEKTVFLSHDWNLNKGQENIRKMKALIPKAKVMVPTMDKKGTICDGITINGNIGVILHG